MGMSKICSALPADRIDEDDEEDEEEDDEKDGEEDEEADEGEGYSE